MAEAMNNNETPIMLGRDDYVFFWKTNEVHGWGSQWFASPFKVKVKLAEDGEEEEEVTFASAEHWMMVQKAILFGDYDKAREILEVTGLSSADMARVKALGREVSGFDEKTWVAKRGEIVLQGNVHKFEQNPVLKEKLLATGEKKIVEASPRDRIWGIGYGEKNAMKQRDSWGLNLLGNALEETRSILVQGRREGVGMTSSEAT